MPTNDANQDGPTEECGVVSTMKLYDRPCNLPVNEGAGTHCLRAHLA